MAPTATIQPSCGTNIVKDDKPRKMRRTRQPRNPQLSVARRNERERNRVKMVNMGFALLREHLPVDDLRNCESPGSGSEGGGKGAASSQATTRAGKKFSKVETLRAAIARIKVLEELIRQTEPHFESLQQHLAATNETTVNAAATSPSASDHDVKPLQSQLSYQDTTSHHQLHQHQQPHPVLPDLEQTMPTMSGDEHTQLWLQQHQNSFMEQQHHYLHHQQQQPNHNQIDWYAHQQQLELEQQQHQQSQQAQKQGNWQFVNQQHQQSNNNDIHLQHQQVESPVWFSGASSSGSPQTPTTTTSAHHHHQAMQVAAPAPVYHSLHQHQQISLYSQ